MQKHVEMKMEMKLQRVIDASQSCCVTEREEIRLLPRCKVDCTIELKTKKAKE